jgi:hypothetical protein
MNSTSKNAVASRSPDEGSAKTPVRTRALKSQLLGGAITLLAGSGLVGITNLAYNVVAARLLGRLHHPDAAVMHHSGLSGSVRKIYRKERSFRGGTV